MQNDRSSHHGSRTRRNRKFLQHNFMSTGTIGVDGHVSQISGVTRTLLWTTVIHFVWVEVRTGGYCIRS